MSSFKKLPCELIYSIFADEVFPDSFVTHDIIHTLRTTLCQPNVHPGLDTEIRLIFRRCSTREAIERSWKLYPDLEHAKACLRAFDPNANPGPGPVSWIIVNCAPCFTFLLDCRAVQATSFCQTGASIFEVARHSGQIGVGARILSLMEHKDLFSPTNLRDTTGVPMSVWEASTTEEHLFRACWKKLELTPERSLQPLGEQAVARICKFADVQLAENLRARGVDLAMPRDNGIPCWIELVCNKSSPEPMLTWFKSRGYRPPGNLLFYAIYYDCSSPNAVDWILLHTKEFEDWSKAASLAASRTDSRSATLFEIILRRPHPESRASATAQNLLIGIVERTCDTAALCSIAMTEGHYDQGMLDAKISELEVSAIRKIKACYGAYGNFNVIGMSIRATENRLYRVASALEGLEDCSKPDISDDHFARNPC